MVRGRVRVGGGRECRERDRGQLRGGELAEDGGDELYALGRVQSVEEARLREALERGRR